MTFRINRKIWSLIHSPEKYAGRCPEVAPNLTESDLWMTIAIDIMPIRLTGRFVDNDSQLGYTLPIHDEHYRIRDNYSDIKTGIIEGTHLKVHLGQAWRIEFSYGNIDLFWTPS
jgi:hypothetical protein